MHNCCIVLLGFERFAFVDWAGLCRIVSDCGGLCLTKPVDRQGPLTIWALMRLIWSASFGPCLCQRPSFDLTSAATDFNQLVVSWLIVWALHINIYKLWHTHYKPVKPCLAPWIGPSASTAFILWGFQAAATISTRRHRLRGCMESLRLKSP